jgi:ParB family transcriptional regulator, chromosome partitioning protein
VYGGGQASAYDVLSGYVEQIDTRRIMDSLRPVRADPGPLEGLMASIIEKGLLEPIVVRPNGDNFEVVAGSRRLQACRMLKLRQVPCHVVELSDRDAYEVALTENIQRRTLNPIEEAEAFKRYVDTYGYGGVNELARKIAKSHSYVSRRISLLSLPPLARENIIQGHTTASAAGELLPLDEISREELTELMSEAGVMTKEDVRKLVRRRKRTAKSQQSFYVKKDLTAHGIDRVLAKCIASLKEGMAKFDHAMAELKDDEVDAWPVKESLLWHRRFMNEQVDHLLRMRRKFRRAANF